ncbi:MAG TPA: NAD(P)H-dependent oxidoreductase [Gemmatimonadales bacterium]|nr:NAD(P)H-dependent oxidoreductase [Gemmatimonadales bacterium]
MHPDDANGRKAPADRPFRVLLIAASNRRQYDCPGIDSKARALMFRMADRLPGDWEIDLEDLGNVWNREQIRTCNGCVSTSAALCVWPCNCYKKGSWGQPDLMWNLDLYARLDLADAWAFISPVNWYGPSSNLKAMFDRLVCMNGGNPRSDLIGHKNPERAIALTHSAQWAELNVNHLEGRTAAFFSYGDGGADEVDDSGRPRILEHRAWFDPRHEPFDDMRQAMAPLVWQCRYSGIQVPNPLWRHAEMGVGRKYSDNQAEHMAEEPEAMRIFDQWTDEFVSHVAEKGKVQPGRYRAYGHRTPFHAWDNLRTKWRGLRMALGVPQPGTSPAIQQERNLNRDTGIAYKKGLGARLRGAWRFWSRLGL